MGEVGLFIVIILSISLRSWWGLTVLQCWGEGQFLLGPVTGTAVLGRAVRYHTGTEPHYSEPSQNTMVKHQSTCPWWYKSKPSNRGRGSCYITCMLISQVSQCFKKNWIMRNDKSLFKVDQVMWIKSMTFWCILRNDWITLSVLQTTMVSTE